MCIGVLLSPKEPEKRSHCLCCRLQMFNLGVMSGAQRNHQMQLRDARNTMMHRGRLADAETIHLRQLGTNTAQIAVSF